MTMDPDFDTLFESCVGETSIESFVDESYGYPDAFYVIDGDYTAGPSSLNDRFAYDAWTSLTPPHDTPRVGLSTFHIGRFGFAAGGFMYKITDESVTTRKYDQDTDGWQTVQNIIVKGLIPPPQTTAWTREAAASSQLNDSGYIFNGLSVIPNQNVSGFPPSTDRYTLSDEWSHVGDFPFLIAATIDPTFQEIPFEQRGAWQMSADVVGDAILVFGGIGISGGGQGLLFRFTEPATMVELPRLPINPARPPLREASAAAVGNDFYSIGGRFSSNSPASGRVDRFDGNVWSVAASMPLNLEKVAAGTLCGKMYVAGGLGDPVHIGGQVIPAVVDFTNVYDPTTDSWSASVNLPFPPRDNAEGVVF